MYWLYRFVAIIALICIFGCTQKEWPHDVNIWHPCEESVIKPMCN